MKIIIKTKKHTFYCNYKKFIKNVVIAATITTWILIYVKWFIQYNAYLNSLMTTFIK